MSQCALDRRDSTRHQPITHAVTILSLILLIGIIACTSILGVQANDSNPVIPSPSPSPSPSPQPHIVTMSNTHSTSVGSESPSTSPSTVPASARGRFAWVMMHYEGTSKDDEYLLGLRVLIRSIQDTKTPYDIVVILSQNVRASTRATLLADGAILNEVPNLQNPFETKVSGRNSYKARFIYSLNKLYIWNMTQYERIAFLDSDNIFLTNMDEIFMCGHFCIVYMNPLIFHTGLIVVKPDESMFRKLLGALYSDESFSHDGADQGFLVAQFDVEHAPLFLPQQYLATGRPSEEPAMRLNIGWNINHFWYYIAFDWNWFFNAGAGTENEYPWIRDYRAVHSLPSSAVVADAGTAAARVSMGKKNLVAGSSIAFCSGMMLKPWYWFPTMYFDHHYSWHQVRDKLNITYYPILLSRLAAFIPVWFIFQYLNNRQRIDRLTVLDTARNWTLKFFMVNPVLFGYLYGFACFLLNGVIVFQLIPYVTPPRFAWSIWCFWHIALMYIELNLLVNIGLRPTANSQKRSLLLVENKSAQGQSDDINNTAATVTGSNALILLSIGQGIFFLSWAHIYPHFIVKIACFEYLLMCWIGIQTHVFRRATEAMCTAVKRQMGMQQ